MNTTILLKTDKALKNDASRVAKELGVPLTTVMNAYLRQFVRDRRISISVEPMPNKAKLALWESISKEMDKDMKTAKRYTSADELIADLKLV
ncbi:MAG: type II toxin-antitoxin system RelB/DinJ family antitoxin [Candidatus Yonathbacteria bacterium]|nr:type II toxin-antitoxin system RelB/DinJ family antitoxin [Candidatus Yonathbacteria bacterium]